MYDPNSVEAIINALRNAGGGSVPNQAMPIQQPHQQLADVVPLPINPGAMAGPPPLAEIVQGKKEIRSGNPNILQHPGRDDWANRIKIRLK